MKTNQILRVNFGKNILSIGHKDRIGNLNELVKIANDYREQKGLTRIALDKILKRKAISEYILHLENKTISNSPEMGCLEISDIKDVNHVLKTKKGKYGGTWADLNIMIRIAIDLDPDFADEVITTFVEGKLLDFRDFAGDDFKVLSTSLELFQPTTFQRIQMAKALNYIVFNKHYANIRNDANENQLQELTELQKKLAFAIDMGYIRTFDELINEMRRIWHIKWRYVNE